MTDQPNKPVRRRGANEVDLIKEAIAEGGYIAVPDQEAEPRRAARLTQTSITTSTHAPTGSAARGSF